MMTSTCRILSEFYVVTLWQLELRWLFASGHLLYHATFQACGLDALRVKTS